MSNPSPLENHRKNKEEEEEERIKKCKKRLCPIFSPLENHRKKSKKRRKTE